jgi:hydrogenase maturation factor HypF (carbamoyltransferase family)
VIVAREIRMEGVVQGVGFRPFVFRLAQEYGIKGFMECIQKQTVLLILSKKWHKKLM